MSWIKLDAFIHKHHKLTSLPTDSARWAFIVTLCEGKVWAGRWQDRAHYRSCIGPLARHLTALVSEGLMEITEDGSVIIHDWEGYQRDPDPKAAERARRWRDERKANAVRTDGERNTNGSERSSRARSDNDSTTTVRSKGRTVPSALSDRRATSAAGDAP